MSDSVFTKIMNGEIPSYKIYEDEHTYSLLTKEPIQLGHTLVVPKVNVNHFMDVPEPYYSAVFFNAKYIAKAVQKATGCTRVGTTVLGWEVPHFHYHLIPMYTAADLNFANAKSRSDDENIQMQRKIISHLEFPV